MTSEKQVRVPPVPADLNAESEQTDDATQSHAPHRCGEGEEEYESQAEASQLASNGSHLHLTLISR